MELTPQQAAKEWKAGKFRPVYLLTGEDTGAKSQFLTQLRESLAPDPFNVDEFAGDPNAEAQAAVSNPQS